MLQFVEEHVINMVTKVNSVLYQTLFNYRIELYSMMVLIFILILHIAV